MSRPKILIAAPTHVSKAYCAFDWIDHLSLLHYDNVELFLSDNSPTEEFASKIRKYGVNCERIDPTGKSVMQALADSHEACRLKAIELNVEYFLHWENDVFSNYRSIIDRLLARQKAVVGAVYHINHGINSHLSIITRKNRHYAEPATTFPLTRGEDLAFVDGHCKRVAHVGLGCVLIHRSVLERISFRPDPKQRTWADTCFAEDCYNNNVGIYADTSLILEHRNKKRHA